uniref:Uncharacterized protein n=1 Tax=Arundo donax TaxID=35708 RepID=A0A0A9H9H2_ARUDO
MHQCFNSSVVLSQEMTCIPLDYFRLIVKEHCLY